ncbi:CAP domain-containing protein [Embleya sp. NPDC050493]|uniref:CAP domain-containing protein n=1 Tax=Embleya sp. NPDC050493 TaxID=3363989 RepID=UPI0037B88B43
MAYVVGASVLALGVSVTVVDQATAPRHDVVEAAPPGDESPAASVSVIPPGPPASSATSDVSAAPRPTPPATRPIARSEPIKAATQPTAAPPPDKAPAEPPAKAAPAPPPVGSSFASTVLRMVNGQRVAAGLRPLATDAELVRVAGAMSRDAATPRHADDTRTGPWGRWNPGLWAHGGRSRTAGIGGANLAFGQTSPEAVVGLWMGSPQHRANILDPRWTRTGAGVHVDDMGVPHWTLLLG